MTPWRRVRSSPPSRAPASRVAPALEVPSPSPPACLSRAPRPSQPPRPVLPASPPSPSPPAIPLSPRLRAASPPSSSSTNPSTATAAACPPRNVAARCSNAKSPPASPLASRAPPQPRKSARLRPTNLRTRSRNAIQTWTSSDPSTPPVTLSSRISRLNPFDFDARRTPPTPRRGTRSSPRCFASSIAWTPSPTPCRADAYPTRFEGSIATSSRSSRRDTGRPRRRAPGDFFAVYSSTAATPPRRRPRRRRRHGASVARQVGPRRIRRAAVHERRRSRGRFSKYSPSVDSFAASVGGDREETTRRGTSGLRRVRGAGRATTRRASDKKCD